MIQQPWFPGAAVTHDQKGICMVGSWAQGVVGTSTTGGQDVGSPNLAEPSHLVSHQAHTWHPSLLCSALTGHNLF